MVWKKSIFAELRSDMSKPPCKKLRKYLTYTHKKFGGHTIKIANSNFFEIKYTECLEYHSKNFP